MFTTKLWKRGFTTPYNLTVENIHEENAEARVQRFVEEAMAVLHAGGAFAIGVNGAGFHISRKT